ncbi:hypothetical protein ACNKHV_12715 [Shigella flexneri]
MKIKRRSGQPTGFAEGAPLELSDGQTGNNCTSGRSEKIEGASRLLRFQKRVVIASTHRQDGLVMFWLHRNIHFDIPVPIFRAIVQINLKTGLW